MGKLGRDELQRLLEEALKRIAEPDVIRKVVEVAQDHAGEVCEPEDEAQFSVYVGGPLYHAVAEVVSDEAADAMMAFLDPILNTWLTQSTSGAWRKRPTGDPSSVSHPLVLIVANNSDDRDVVTRMLCNEGYAVLCASSGKEAIAQCRERPPSIVVADGALSGPVDARRLVKLIRMGLEDAMPPVIMLQDSPAEAPSGVAGIVPKKPYPAKLLDIIKQVMPIEKPEAD